MTRHLDPASLTNTGPGSIDPNGTYTVHPGGHMARQDYKYEWTAPSGAWVRSCKPFREDEWLKHGTLGYLRHSYANIIKVVFWREPRRDLRIWLAERGANPALACRVSGHVYGHMTGVCFCGAAKRKSGE